MIQIIMNVYLRELVIKREREECVCMRVCVLMCVSLCYNLSNDDIRW